MTLNDERVEGWRPERLQQRFLVLRKLGQGTYGKVQLALNKETNQEVAIKTIKKARIESEEDMLRIRREIQIMAAIRHPHIIHINEVFETRQKIVIVMQYASGGELYDYLGCHQKLPEVEARRVFRQISSAIYYCHKNRICHRDLKLENILLDEEGNAQIADFGLSNIFDERRRMSTFCGSPLYASPEIVKGTPYKGPEVDCWSLGVLLYTLIYGTMPFDGKTFKELVTQISEGKYEEPINKSRASGLIRSLLTPDISKRATITDVCKDTWVNDGCNISLLELAKQMANQLNGEISSKLCLEKIPKNGFSFKTNFSSGNGKITSLFKDYDLVNQKVCDKPNLYEQILTYDVRFIINKLLTAVESSEKETKKCPIKEKPKVWPRNGEIGSSSKVDSAYVIPIFEVTSVVPKLPSKIARFYHKASTEQNFGPSESNKNFIDSAIGSQKESAKIKNNINKTIQNTAISKVAIINEILNKEKNSCQKQNSSSEIISEVTDKSTSAQRLNVTIDGSTNQENILSRTPKLKKKEQSILQSKTGPFFRSKNHALTIARIFSMNFDKLNLSTRKLRRQEKSPGKVVIPATFDPSYIENTVCEQKQIFIFPTISVSENKEKIEKKIDKIKKAALNMNMIVRSNSKNRLKIQKYLKSQAKKMQDLVFDEQRIINASIGRVKRSETISAISDAYFGKRCINSFNVGHHCRKINFSSTRNDSIETSNYEEHQKTYLKESYFLSPNSMTDGNFGTSNITKSRSEEIRFPDSYNNSNFDSFHANVQNAFEKEINSLRMFSNKIPEKFLYLTNNSYEMSDDIPDDKNDQKFQANAEKTTQILQDSVEITELTKNDDNKGLEQKSCTSNTDLVINEGQTQLCDLDLLDLSDMLSHLGTSQNLVDKSATQSETKLKRLASEPSLRYDGFKSELSIAKKSTTFHYKKGSKSKWELGRRNTLSCITEFSGDKKYISLKERQENSPLQKDDFQDCLWMMYVNNKILNAHANNDIAFSSAPNILSQYERFLNNKNSKGIDEMNQKFYEALLSNAPVYGLNEAKSAFLRKLLQKTDSNGINSYKSKNHTRKGISVSEEILSNNVRAESIRKAQSERKLSHGIETWDARKTPFLSKFLNELEKQEYAIQKSKVSNRKPHKQSFPELGKKSKTENRNKSFLQLMALKRIQEAEKELNKIDRNIENEDSGSLLEALKTHGYKNVISQRFQSDNDTENLFSYKYPMKRTLMKDIPRSYFNNFDPSPYNSPLHLDYGEHDDFIEPTSPLSFHTDISYSPQFSKQFVKDWLTTNLSEKYLNTPERNVPIIPEEEIQMTNRRFLRESSQSLEEPSDSFDFLKECNSSRANDLNIVSEDIINPINGSDQHDYLRTSSTSDDEREESVQDRIWRKSFYSRFNNSALSRKERSRYLEAGVLSERSSLFNGSNSPVATLPRSESFQMNGFKKNSTLKRAATLRPPRSRKSSTDSENSFKLRSVKSFKYTPTENPQGFDADNHVESFENFKNQ